ncbi:MAG: hypothetical protein JO016_05145 [Actinobacteria bacterium]|nr:hypothetical protein [Actinomycetota bacterium]
MPGHRRSNGPTGRRRTARLAIPLAVPMALGLTLGIILGVSGGARHTSIQQAAQSAATAPATVSASPSLVIKPTSAHRHRSAHHSTSRLVISSATPAG